MYAERHEITLTTNSDGDAIGYIPVSTGRLINLIYTKAAGAAAYAEGVDFVITAEATGQTLWSELNVDASKTVAPRQATHSTAGVAAVYAGAGEAVRDYIVLVKDRIKIVVDDGGNVKSGTFTAVLA